MTTRLRSIGLFLLVIAFGVLLFGGYLMNREKPPLPEIVFADGDEVLFTGEDIIAGQNYYFSRGGMHIGSIWGHGSYLAPDWSADYLHRLGLYLAARHHGLTPEAARTFTQDDFDHLDAVTQARLSALVTEEIKLNRYDPGSNVLTFSPWQVEAFEALTDYYTELFLYGEERMGLQPGIVREPAEGQILTSFFAWLA